MESEPADQLAGADRQQSGERELRQADHEGLRRRWGTGCTAVTNPFGPVGAPSADAPPLQFSVRARYEWSFDDYTAFVQAGVTHTGYSFTQAGSNPTIAGRGAVTTSQRAVRESRVLDRQRLGRHRQGPWWFNVYCENLANSNASTFISTDQFIVEQSPLRPRVSEVRSATNSKRGAKPLVGRVCARQGCRAAAPNARWRPRVAAG